MDGSASGKIGQNRLIVSRREFLATAGIVAGGLAFVPRHVIAAAGVPNPSDVITIAGVAEMIAAGTIGEVRQVYCWSNRPLWPQGMLRPTNTDPVPKTLDWDLWIGPAPMRPFVERWPDGHYALRQVEAGAPPFPAVYHPWNFRGWWDFGTGALGDMGCHHFNAVFAAMKFRHPVAIEATSTKVFEETAPLASIVSYDFPAREGLSACRMTWLDGGLKPPCPEGLDRELPDESDLYIGDKGFILGSEVIGRKGQTLTPPAKTLQRRGGTWAEWIEAIRTGKPAGCDFEWAAYLTEATLLGNIAIRVGKRIEYDGAAMKFANSDKANALLRSEYRSGWTL